MKTKHNKNVTLKPEKNRFTGTLKLFHTNVQ